MSAEEVRVKVVTEAARKAKEEAREVESGKKGKKKYSRGRNRKGYAGSHTGGLGWRQLKKTRKGSSQQATQKTG